MRSAARLAPSGDVSYGGYIVPVMAGERPDGILTKILSLVGGGGKALECPSPHTVPLVRANRFAMMVSLD